MNSLLLIAALSLMVGAAVWAFRSGKKIGRIDGAEEANEQNNESWETFLTNLDDVIDNPNFVIGVHNTQRERKFAIAKIRARSNTVRSRGTE